MEAIVRRGITMAEGLDSILDNSTAVVAGGIEAKKHYTAFISMR